MADTEKMETAERFKKAYELGRECGEYVKEFDDNPEELKEFDYDPDKGVFTAMYDYEEHVGCDYAETPADMRIDNDPDLIDKWEDGFIDGYEQR